MEWKITLSEEAVARLLVGMPVEISVGEPWDFEGPDGPNALKGVITAAGEDVPGDPDSQWIVVQVTPFVAKGGRSVDHLKARRRHVLPEGRLAIVASGEHASVNLGYGDQVGEEDLPEGTRPFLIGGLRLLPRQEAEGGR